eukprot:4828649-Amphidinium_carterae.1
MEQVPDVSVATAASRTECTHNVADAMQLLPAQMLVWGEEAKEHTWKAKAPHKHRGGDFSGDGVRESDAMLSITVLHLSVVGHLVVDGIQPVPTGWLHCNARALKRGLIVEHLPHSFNLMHPLAIGQADHSSGTSLYASECLHP